MSKPANPSLIGVFVLGGILLLIIGIGLFGAGYFQGKELDLICFFEDSVNGLDVGSPVKFKGVTIGKVSEVLLRTRNQEENDNAVPVIIAIDPKLLASRGIATYLTDKEKRVQSVEKGLRARLQQQSVITGMLYIELDFYPGNPAKYHKKNQDGGLVEVPTVVSNLGTLMRAATRTIEQFSQIQFAAMGEKMNRILTQLETGADAVDFKSINKGVLAVTTSATELLQDENVRLAAGNLNAALKDFQKLAQKLEGKVDPLSDEVQKTAAEARNTLAQIHLAAENLRLLSQPGAGLRSSLDETLQEITDAAQAVRTLADYLERNPSVLLRGKVGADSGGTNK